MFEDESLQIFKVGKTVFDVSAKSEAWKEGYYGCLMGGARAAENLEGWVRDTTRNIAFPGEMMIGPSNPRPKPVPYGAYSAPFEENCVEAFESPETFYRKILETKGFNTRQRLDTAIAYADWLDFKGLPVKAKAIYDFALNEAVAALPPGVDLID